jgi:hypothetical protein
MLVLKEWSNPPTGRPTVRDWLSASKQSVKEWLKARASQIDCVEISRSDDSQIRMRHSKSQNAVLRFSPAEFHAFLDGVKAGEFDLAALPK